MSLDVPYQIAACKRRIGTLRTLLEKAKARGETPSEVETANRFRSGAAPHVGASPTAGDSRDSDGMGARQHNDGASFGPDTLKAMGEAFDKAWSEIAEKFGNGPIDIDNARYRLANALLTVAREDSQDVELLKDAALQRMALDDRSR